jgi:hypothetical protein
VKPFEPKQYCRAVQSVDFEKRNSGIQVISFKEQHHLQHPFGQNRQFPTVQTIHPDAPLGEGKPNTKRVQTLR